jgi:uncharacterized membrane protein
MSTDIRTEVQDYLNRMRAALADLPDAEVAEIMDDAGTHVVEVADELGAEFSAEALATRLGTPEVYARELRVAAGYPMPAPVLATTSAKYSITARFVFWSLVAGTAAAFAFGIGGGEGEELVLLLGLCVIAAFVLLNREASLLGQVTRLPENVALQSALRQVEQAGPAKVFAYLRGLQPAWWLLRALLIMVPAVFFRGFSLIFLIGIGLAVLSLVAGPKSKTDRRWLWISLPASAFAIGVGLLVLGAMSYRVDRVFNGSSSSQSSYVPPDPRPSNIYVFDKDGKPISDVFLYDEEGQAIDTPWRGCEDGMYRADNRYPKPKVEYDKGLCRQITGAPFAVVIPTLTTPQTTSAPSGSVAPSSSSAPVAPTSVTPTS